MYLVGLIILLHDSGTFWLYGAVCLVGTIYTIFFVPETKGKTIEEIQQMFSSSSEEKSRGPDLPKAQVWFCFRLFFMFCNCCITLSIRY